MEIQEQRKVECPDGRCPVGIDSVKEICLTPLESKAIFFTLKRKIDEFKKSLSK